MSMNILKDNNGNVLLSGGLPIIAGNSGLDYTVTFVVNGETKYIISVLAGESINEPPAFSEEGKAWFGWYDGLEYNSNQVVFPITPNADTVIYGRLATRTA